MRTTFSMIVAMSLLASGAVARAQQAVPAQPMATQPQPAPLAQPQALAPATKPGYRTHDGLFLQLSSGVGYMGSDGSVSTFAYDSKMSGGAGSFFAAVGGAVLPNLIVGGMLWDAVVLAPDVEVNGASQSNTDAALGLFGVGVNVTYYIMPANVYLSATPSMGILSVAHQGTTYDTNPGFALLLAVGKEWWITGNWGLGANLQYAYGSNEEKDSPVQWKSNWFGVAFSATYN